MRGAARSIIGLTLVVIATASLAPPIALAQSAPEGEAALRTMTEYLARDGGKWKAPNPQHDPDNERSPDAFGLWFEPAARGGVLELTVVLHYGDEVRKSTRGYWFWHPVRDEVLYQEVSPGGSIRSGTAHFTDASTFVTLTEAFSRSGDTAMNRGVNELLTEDSHHTTAYARGPEGEWVKQQELTWTRVAPES